MQRSTRMPLMVGFTKTFDLAEASVGCWFLERDFVGLFGSAPLSAPEIDLSVFPIVPPVEPACASGASNGRSPVMTPLVERPPHEPDCARAGSCKICPISLPKTRPSRSRSCRPDHHPLDRRRSRPAWLD